MHIHTECMTHQSFQPCERVLNSWYARANSNFKLQIFGVIALYVFTDHMTGMMYTQQVDLSVYGCSVLHSSSIGAISREMNPRLSPAKNSSRPLCGPP